MKRFIIISLLAAFMLPAAACIWIENYNDYLFSPCDPMEFSSRVEQTCNDNWKAYMGDDLKDKVYYWFNADDAIESARKKNDPLMVSYIQNLKKYLECAEEKRQEQWDYPTKEQLAKRKQTLLAVRAYAQTKLKTRLRSQHALLTMRCNMMLGDHAQNVTFWHTTGSKMIESVYREMMRNIYAGALYKTGSEYEAAQTFAEQGDWQSLMTIYYKRRSCAAIRQEYERYPDSAVLPFLLKDFVNNAQEAIDAQNDEDAIGGKLFIRDITQQEARQMCQLCQQVVEEGKTNVPIMWQSAKAWLEFLFGNHQQGISDIHTAMTLSGTERMKDNARVLQFYMKASQMASGKELDDYVAAELQWLDSKKSEDVFFNAALGRIAHQVLMTRYANQPARLLAIENATECSEFLWTADTMRVESMLKFIEYSTSSANNNLDAYLKKYLKNDSAATNDLIGTKYLRLCQWEKAADWLLKVPSSYYDNRGYTAYAANRHFDVEPWITRQWVSDDVVYKDTVWQLKHNPKLTFAREMQRLEIGERYLTGSALQQCYYDQAIRYAQASYTGDCWYVMRDGKSCGDTVRSNEVDLAARAVQLLRKVSTAADARLKESALFALCYVYLNQQPWYEDVWDDKTSKFMRRANRLSDNWQNFAALADYEKKNATHTSQYVSRCDEYQQFLKHYKD